MGPRRQKPQPYTNMQQAQPVHQHYLQQYLALHNFEVDPNLQAQLVSPAPRTNEDLNVSVLQRYNAEVIGLEHVATFGTLYEFEEQWEKSVVEGPLFIVKLWPNAEADVRYAVMILNRRGLKNFSYELKLEDHVEAAPELVSLTNENDGEAIKAWGIYIFSEPPPSSTANQPQEFADKIRECVQKTQVARSEKAEQRTHHHIQTVDSTASQQLNIRDHFGEEHRNDPLASTTAPMPQTDGLVSTFAHLTTNPATMPHSTTPSQPATSVNPTPGPSAMPTPSMFAHSAETSFFLAPSQRATPSLPQQQQTPLAPSIGGDTTEEQREHLLNLFRHAGSLAKS